MSRKRFRRDRYLTLLEVADLLKLPHQEKDDRRRVVRRMLRRLEIRDGVSYMRTVGRPGPGSRLFVPVSALEQLTPWDAGTLTAMREDIDGLGVRVKRAERRIDGHDRDISDLRLIAQKSAELSEVVSRVVSRSAPKAGQSGPKAGQKQQLIR